MPAARMRIVSVTSSAVSRSTCTSLRKERMRSSPGAAVGCALPSSSQAKAASSSAGSLAVSDTGSVELDDRRRLDRRVAILVEFGFGEAHRPRDHHVGEGLNARIEVADGGVVIAPRALELLLDGAELVLELAEIVVGLEVGIGFRHRQQPAEQPGHR